jgi:hypothetical protein
VYLLSIGGTILINLEMVVDVSVARVIVEEIVMNDTV